MTLQIGKFTHAQQFYCIVTTLVPYLRPCQTRTRCCGHIVADTNVSPFARARNICCGHKFCVRDTNFVSGTQKCFWFCSETFLCPQQMFPSLRSPRNIMGNNVSATMCPRLPGPLVTGLHLVSHEHGTKNSESQWKLNTVLVAILSKHS